MIKGILFDKDGTLIDTYAVCLQMAKYGAKKCREHYKMEPYGEKEMMDCIGIHDDCFESNSLIMAKTNRDVAEAWYALAAPKTDRDEFIQYALEQMAIYATAPDTVYTEMTGAKRVLAELHKDYVLGVVTADMRDATEFSLTSAGMAPYIRFISAVDDKIPGKPHPDAFLYFLKRFLLRPEEVVMVGDSVTDAEFARNCGIPLIGVSSGTEYNEELVQLSDYPADSIQEVPQIVRILNAQ